MIRYEYECDTCSENHFAEFETAEDAREWRELWELEGFKTWEVN
jgi:hypothetical protein